MSRSIVFLIPSMNGGGAEKVTLLLGNELANNGYKVTFLMNKLEGPYFDKISKKIEVIQLPNKKISRNIPSIVKYLRDHKIDIFYSSMNFVNIIAGISHYLSNSKSKLILSDHNDIIEVLKNYGSKSFFIDKLIGVFYKRADAIVGVSEGVKNSIEIKYAQVKNIQVIYNPIEQFNPNFTKPTNCINLLSIGRLSKQKNQIHLIKAFQKVKNLFPDKNLTLTILGEGDKRVELENYINKNQLQKHVSLPGFQDIQNFFDKTHLFVLSSEREGFGNVLVEALSAGLPVISTDCPSGPSEILNNGEFGTLVPVNDIDKLSEAIISEIEAHTFEQEKILKRIERARDFSPKKIVSQYITLFDKILRT